MRQQPEIVESRPLVVRARSPMGRANRGQARWAPRGRARGRSAGRAPPGYHQAVRPLANRWAVLRRPRAAAALCSLLTLGSAGCEWLGRTYWLHKYERDATLATRAMERAGSAGERATHLAERGRAYSEKARYSMFAKCIGWADYERLFARAIADHDQAVALAPSQSDVYCQRGSTYYDRAGLTPDDRQARDPWLGRAEADFTRALERDPRNVQALDMRALSRQVRGDWDGAITDLTRSLNLDPSGSFRLMEAYCERGQLRHRRKDVAGAIADYEQSIMVGGGGPSDGCSCDPYAPLAYAYFEDAQQIDKAWSTIRRARAGRHWIPPELVDKLSKASGRTP